MSRHSDDGNTDESGNHSANHRSGQVSRTAQEERCEYGPESRTGTQGYGLAQSHSEITHRKAEGESAHSPEHSEDHSQGCLARIAGVEAEKTGVGRNGKHCSGERENEPRKQALHQPESLPAPGSDFADGNITA